MSDVKTWSRTSALLVGAVLATISARGEAQHHHHHRQEAAAAPAEEPPAPAPAHEAAPTRASGILSVGAGWPSVWGQYTFPHAGKFSLALRADLFYGYPVGFLPGTVGLGVSVPMRLRLTSGRVAVDLTLVPFGDWLTYRNVNAFVMGLEPGVVVALPLATRPVLTLLAGAAIPWMVILFPNVAPNQFLVPIVAQAGLTWQPSARNVLGVLGRVGPAFGSVTQLYFTLYAFLAHAF